MFDLNESNINYLLEKTDELEARIECLEADNEALRKALGIKKNESRKTRFCRKVSNLLRHR